MGAGSSCHFSLWRTSVAATITERFALLPLTENRHFLGLFEPDLEARIMMQMGQNGELGYIVMHHGELKVRRNLVNELLLTPWSESNGGGWRELDTQFLLGPGQACRVAFEADRALLGALARYEESRIVWDQLNDRERMMFIKNGPKDHSLRILLYKRIMEVLGGTTSPR